MIKRSCILLISLLLLISLAGGCSSNQADTQPVVKIPELTIASSPGPISYPLAYMAENNVLANVADKTTLTSWSTADQLKAMVTSGQVQFAATPITNAMLLYNKGVDIKLVNVAVWGMLYLISSDENLKSLDQLKGKEIAVAGKGGLHDLVLRHLLLKNGIDPDKDLKLTYMDMAQASSNLLSGKLQYAILNEPNSSATLANAKKNNVKLYRSLDIQNEWAVVTGNPDARIPWAGLIVVGDSAKNDLLVKTVVDQFDAAAEWDLENAESAGQLTEKYFQNMKAQAVTNSLPYSRLDPMSAKDSQKQIEDFFNELMTTAPMEAIGGKIPDEGLYYQSK